MLRSMNISPAKLPLQIIEREPAAARPAPLLRKTGDAPITS
jgi:hypothetical protein